MKTAVVESDQVGGRCLNYACIPAKAVLRVADVLGEIREAATSASPSREPIVDFDGVGARRKKVIKTLTGGVAGLFKKNGIDVIEGHGVGDRRRQRQGRRQLRRHRDRGEVRHPRDRLGEEAAAGHALRRPRHRHRGGVGARASCRRRSRSSAPARRAPRSPRPTRAWAPTCTLYEGLDRVLPTEDADISKLAERGFKKQGIKVRTGVFVENVAVRRRRRDVHGRGRAGEADWLVIAAGRAPDVEGLGLDEAGIKLTDDGLIAVDGALRTSLAGVYAIGDLVPGPALAHKASDEGIIAAEDAAGLQTHPIELRRHPARDVLHAERRRASG